VDRQGSGRNAALNRQDASVASVLDRERSSEPFAVL